MDPAALSAAKEKMEEKKEDRGEEKKEEKKEVRKEHLLQPGASNSVDPWLKIKLYDIMESGKHEQWDEYQKTLKPDDLSTRPEGDEAKLYQLLSKPLKDLVGEERKALAGIAFRAGLESNEEVIMCHILSVEPIVDLRLEDIVDLTRKECWSVLKTMVDKRAPVTRAIIKGLQSTKYNRAKRILDLLSQDQEAHYIEIGDIVSYMVKANMDNGKIEKWILFANNPKETTAIRSLLVHGKEKVAERLFRDGKATATDEILTIAIEYKCYNFFLLYLKASNYEVNDEKAAIPFFIKVANLIKEDLAHIELYLFFLRKYEKVIPLDAARVLIETLNEWIHSQELMIGFVKSSVNPVKVCVLFLELLKLMEDEHKTLAKWFEDKTADLIELASLLLGEIHDDTDLHSILVDTDLEGRPLIQIIAFNGFLQLFKHKSINTVTDKIWSGPYVVNSDPVSPSSLLLANLTCNPFSSLDHFARNYRKVTNRDYTTFDTHNYQYVTWRDGLRARYILDAVYFVFMFIFGYYLYYNMMASVRKAFDTVRERQLKQEAIPLPDLLLVYTYIKDMYYYSQMGNYAFLVIFILNFRHIFAIVYSWLTRRSLAALSFEMILDTLTNIGIALYYFYAMSCLSELKDYENNVPYYVVKAVENTSSNEWIIPTTTGVVILLFLRALNTLEVHIIFGPFVKMIKQMAAKMGTFGLLFITLLMMFVLISYVYNPYHLEMYTSIYRSFLSLFQSSIAVFDLNAMKGELRAELFTILYVVIFNIMLLNLLVAILTQVYETINQKAEMLYVDELVVLHSLFEPHQSYGSLMASYPPLNSILPIFFLPVLLFVRPASRPQLNEIFLRVQYVFAFIMILPIYLGIEVVLFVLCYAKVSFQMLIQIFIGRDYPSPLRRMANFFGFLILGPLLLLPVLFSDVYYFTLHAFLHEGEARFPEQSKEPLDKTIFRRLLVFVRDVRQKRYGALSWAKLCKPMYDLCDINIAGAVQEIRLAANNKQETSGMGETGMLHQRTQRKSKFLNYKNFGIVSGLIKSVGRKSDKGEIIIDIDTLHLLLQNYYLLSKLLKTQAALLNVQFDGLKKGIKKERKETVEMPVVNLASPSLGGSNANVMYMKLFSTYNTERYYNALISFKGRMNRHWLAKNLLMMSADALKIKSMIVPRVKPPQKPPEEKKNEVAKDDSKTDARNSSLVMLDRDLEEITKKIESGNLSMAESPKGTILGAPHISMAAKGKSSMLSVSGEEDL